jgi:hypothetical protein
LVGITEGKELFGRHTPTREFVIQVFMKMNRIRVADCIYLSQNTNQQQIQLGEDSFNSMKTCQFLHLTETL